MHVVNLLTWSAQRRRRETRLKKVTIKVLEELSESPLKNATQRIVFFRKQISYSELSKRLKQNGREREVVSLSY